MCIRDRLYIFSISELPVIPLQASLLIPSIPISFHSLLAFTILCTTINSSSSYTSHTTSLNLFTITFSRSHCAISSEVSSEVTDWFSSYRSAPLHCLQLAPKSPIH
eukprot:TRINITY_DN6050_c0_g1_i10.p3 TRINITY_DN6050_c0_g1~~TRINITY_DN6050_c0_g1_i10.p3  ORF type:complete len:106 (+),score=4.90 TRINITY_DN6050_c0_g1_i10:65-382(+)